MSPFPLNPVVIGEWVAVIEAVLGDDLGHPLGVDGTVGSLNQGPDPGPGARTADREQDAAQVWPSPDSRFWTSSAIIA
ncbi:MAG: hypothetical protein H0W55_15710 [Actinobacteria bacterium]|nr:hypothetical protein [Actinomycetota bacterium]MDQ3531151.1 hypothetical protein [Actinomycetota bacterium]